MQRALLLLLLAGAPALAIADTPSADQSPWWIGHLINFVSILIGALMIVFQLGQQHKNESRRQAENFKGQLRLQIYQEFSEKLADASSATIDAVVYASQCDLQSKIYSNQVAKGMDPKPVEGRALLLMEKYGNLSSEATKVVLLVEKYTIIHPDIDIFNTAIAAGLHDFSCAFQDLSDFMIKHFPVDRAESEETKIENIKALDSEELKVLSKLAENFQESANTVGCYFDDMRTELQMLLLGYLFPNEIPRRRPADPTVRVVTLEPATVKSLRQHFVKNSSWGQQAVKGIFEVHREFNRP